MKGFDVVTTDDEKVGHVVGRDGSYLIIEHGTLFKARHALPDTFAHVDEGSGRVRISVPKNVFDDSPKLDDEGRFDEEAVAMHYGLAQAEAAPETEGYGELEPDEIAVSAEVQERRAGLETAVEERARVRETMRPEGRDPAVEGLPGRPIHPDRRGYGESDEQQSRPV